jgi:hypothetical protein
MNAKKIILTTVVLAVAGTAVFFGIKTWRAGVVIRQEQRAFKVAEKLVAESKFEDALAVIRQQPTVNASQNWPVLEVRALAGLRAAPQLAAIYQRTPERILADETASVMLARAYMSSRNAALFAAVRDAWRGHETRRDDWLVLDSDAQLLANRSREAEKILRAQKLSGKAEAARLERLSLLVAGRDLPQAWELLAEASRLDPRNSEIRSFRAQILEASGKIGAAKVEYTAALAADKNDSLLRDQLAEFYCRQADYDFALKLWEESLADATFDFVWLKTAFWQRMVLPGKLDAGKVADGELQPLARWIAGLPAGTYFDTNSFAALPQAQRLEQRRQEIFWLQLVDALQNHREKEATELLKFNRFSAVSWQPDLQAVLARILHYRQKHSFNPEGLIYTSATPAASQHQFFTTLAELAKREHTEGRVAVPADFDALLRGPDAFAAAFLAAGWREAALNLCSPENCPTNEPVWFAYGIANALRENRGAAAAQNFLAHRQPAPELQLLAAEMLIADGKTREGIDRLPALASANSPVGYRASCLLALVNLDLKRYDAARGWVRNNPQLAADLTGRELLAQIALRAGQTNEAENIYRSILSDSTEAKIYFGRKAFEHRDWKSARDLTLELVRAQPDNLQFRANLLAIDRAEAGK